MNVVAAILLGTRLVIAGMFVRSGTVKLVGRGRFRQAVANYDIVPAGLVGAVAAAVPMVEAVAGILLLLGVLPGMTAAVLAALLLCFAAVIAVNLSRGRVFECGCGGYGPAPAVISWRHVTVNVLLAASAAAIAVAPPAGLSLVPGPGGVFAIGIPPGTGVPVALAAALVLLTARTLGAAVAVRRLLRSREAS